MREVMIRCTGTGYPAINASDLKQITILMPCLAEQKKIAELLTAIDLRIIKEKGRLGMLIEEKKGFMQKMFV